MPATGKLGGVGAYVIVAVSYTVEVARPPVPMPASVVAMLVLPLLIVSSSELVGEVEPV